MITRSHFVGYRPGDCNAPPPLHVQPLADAACWVPAPRPLQAYATPGPTVIDTAAAETTLGLDPTDPSTWGPRGYYPASGMISWLSDTGDMRGP